MPRLIIPMTVPSRGHPVEPICQRWAAGAGHTLRRQCRPAPNLRTHVSGDHPAPQVVVTAHPESDQQIDSFVFEKFRRRLLEATSQTAINNRPAQTMLAVQSEGCTGRLPRAYHSVTNILQEPVSRDFTALAVLHSLSIDPSADS